MDGIKLVFDIDDTICNNKNRDYENAIPIQEVITKINHLHKQGLVLRLNVLILVAFQLQVLSF